MSPSWWCYIVATASSGNYSRCISDVDTLVRAGFGAQQSHQPLRCYCVPGCKLTVTQSTSVKCLFTHTPKLWNSMWAINLNSLWKWVENKEQKTKTMKWDLSFLFNMENNELQRMKSCKSICAEFQQWHNNLSHNLRVLVNTVASKQEEPGFDSVGIYQYKSLIWLTVRAQ